MSDRRTPVRGPSASRARRPVPPVASVAAGAPTVDDGVATIPFRIGADRRTVWIRAEAIDPASAADAALVLGYGLAMGLGAALVHESPVSEALARRIAPFGDVQRSWYPRLGSPTVAGPTRPDGGRTGPGERGAFFSGGLDSFHTAISEQDSLDALVFVVGADIPVREPWLAGHVAARLELAAAALGRPLVRVATNVREVTDDYAEWEWFVGVAMSAVALALAPRFERILYSASHTAGMAAGRRTDDEPIAGDTLRVLRYEGAPNRVAKARAVAEIDAVRAHLRVCWENRGGAYNCGRCAKCLRTMAELAAAGGLAGIQTLPAHVDVDAATRRLDAHDGERDFLAELPPASGPPRQGGRPAGALDAAVAEVRRRLGPARRRILRPTRRFDGATPPPAVDPGLPPQCARAVELSTRLAAVLRPLLAPHRSVALVGTSLLNAGDAAIWAGTVRLLERWQIDVAHVSMFPYLDADRLRRRVPVGPVLLAGGGNLGSLYPPLQQFRDEVLACFRDRPIIQLPQSIHVDARDEHVVGRRLRAHPDLTLCVRDEPSRERAARLGVDAWLCPDMAFALAGPELPAPRPGGSRVVWVGRNDAERNPARPPATPDVDYVDWGRGTTARRTFDATILRAANWAAPASVATVRARAALRRAAWAWQRIGTAPAVITERLHGHVLCVLTGTPHVVVPDAHGKIADFAETWGTLRDGAHLLERPGDAVEMARKLAAADRGTAA